MRDGEDTFGQNRRSTMAPEKVRKIWPALALAIVVCSGGAARAENDPRLYAVEVTANISSAPAQVRLSWPADTNAASYSVSRKLQNTSAWTSLGALPASATAYTDANVSVGNVFEYRITKATSLGFTAYGFILAWPLSGSQIPAGLNPSPPAGAPLRRIAKHDSIMLITSFVGWL